VQTTTRDRILAHAEKNCAGRFESLDVRFRGALCYIDAYLEASTYPTHLVRLRFFGDENQWTLAFFTYSHERYEVTFFPDGEDHGTPEAALDVGSVYLSDLR
jgi:hypothetical protein